MMDGRGKRSGISERNCSVRAKNILVIYSQVYCLVMCIYVITSRFVNDFTFRVRQKDVDDG